MAFQSFGFERSWMKVLSVPEWRFWAFLNEGFECSWMKVLSVPEWRFWAFLNEGFERSWMKVLSIPEWRLFQKRVVCTRLNIYGVCLLQVETFLPLKMSFYMCFFLRTNVHVYLYLSFSPFFNVSNLYLSFIYKCMFIVYSMFSFIEQYFFLYVKRYIYKYCK